MNSAQNRTLSVLALLGFLLGLALLAFQFQNQRAETHLVADQSKFTQLQEELGRGEVSRRVLQNIVGDLSAMAPQKPEVQGMLSRYGVNLKNEQSR